MLPFRRAAMMMMMSTAKAAPVVQPDNMLQWPLADNAADTVVSSSEINGTMRGGNTADVAATLGGKPAFHLNGSSQYFDIAIPASPAVWPSQVANLWTKYASNPVLTLHRFGQLWPKPGGGWYWFGSDGAKIQRWESADLKTWSNKTLALDKGGAGSWDAGSLEVASVFQKPSGAWVLLYRGNDGAGNLHIGMATSADGSTPFTRKNNGGVNDGLFSQFGDNYDPVGVILVGSRYYLYTNGAGGHGVTNLYYSDDDFATFAAAANNPLYFGDSYCSFVFKRGSYYYALVPTDRVFSGSTLYYHTIAVYRSTVPEFTPATIEFMGHAIVNDQTYDNTYLDTPSMPFTDIYRATYSPDFGDTAYMMYDGLPAAGERAQNLATISWSDFDKLKRRIRGIINVPLSISFKVQFDTLADGNIVLSCGNSAADGSPSWLLGVTTVSTEKRLRMYLSGYVNASGPALAVDTLYHVVITEDYLGSKKLYINKNLVATSSNAHRTACANLYIGTGFGPGFLDGYIQDLRLYPWTLSQSEIDTLDATGNVGVSI